MPSLKLSNPFRQGVDRPSLRERAAALKATAGRVMRRPKIRISEAADAADPLPPIDWLSPPPGFMASPAIEPHSFLSIPLGLKREAERLHGVARAEFERRRGDYNLVPFRTEADWNAHLRRLLRLDALAAAASPEPVEPAGDDRTDPGFVLYEDAGGTTYRRPVAAWISFMAQRLYGVARHEMGRASGVEADGLCNEEAEALNARLRQDLRIDALDDLAFRSREIFEASREYAVGARWRYGRGDTSVAESDSPDCSDRRDLPGVFLAGLDFSSLSMRTLDTMQHQAGTLITVCLGLAAQPCSHRPDGGINEAGAVMYRLVEDLLPWVANACEQEARRRTNAEGDDARVRAWMLARPTVENDDPDEIRAFARDLLVLADA